MRWQFSFGRYETKKILQRISFNSWLLSFNFPLILFPFFLNGMSQKALQFSSLSIYRSHITKQNVLCVIAINSCGKRNFNCFNNSSQYDDKTEFSLNMKKRKIILLFHGRIQIFCMILSEENNNTTNKSKRNEKSKKKKEKMLSQSLNGKMLLNIHPEPYQMCQNLFEFQRNYDVFSISFLHYFFALSFVLEYINMLEENKTKMRNFCLNSMS